MSTVQPFIVTYDEILAINTARDVLARLRTRARYEHDSQGSGIVAGAAMHASDSLFNVLNFARSYADCDIPLSSLHNRKGGL